MQRMVTRLPSPVLELVLQHLPCVEVARLAAVHKAFLCAWQQLRVRGPASRWEPPSAEEQAWLAAAGPLERAAWFSNESIVARLLAVAADVLDCFDSIRVGVCSHSQRTIALETLAITLE